MRRKKIVFRIFGTILAVIFAVLFIYPTVVTLADSFMSSQEITSHYGDVLENQNSDSNIMWGVGEEKDTSYKSDHVKITVIPDKVTLSQYAAVLFTSPEYLFKFWNSVKLVVPIVVFQIIVAFLPRTVLRDTGEELRSLHFFCILFSC